MIEKKLVNQPNLHQIILKIGKWPTDWGEGCLHQRGSRELPCGFQNGEGLSWCWKGKLPEWEVLLLPSWVSDWLWLTGVRSWQLWMGESLPVGSVPDGFSIFFISISSWCIQRSGGLRSFWLPFLLPTLWVARFLWNKNWKANVSAFVQCSFLSFLSQFKLEAEMDTRVLPGGNLRNPGIGRHVLAAFPHLPWSFTTL